MVDLHQAAATRATTGTAEAGRLLELAAGLPTAVAVSDGTTYWFDVEPGVRFQAASISKPVGAVVALSLVADGVLGLDDDVAPLLRSWSIPDLGDWTPRITLRHLLTHSAGLTVHGFPGVPPDEPKPSLVDILDGRSNTPRVVVDLAPGLTARYSGGGYVLLEVLLEDLTGRTYAELATERVLQPAGMGSSGYDLPSSVAPALHADGTAVPEGPHWYAPLVGGLWTTPADLVAFAGAVQRGLLLPAELGAELLTEQLPGWGLGVQLWSHHRFGHGGSNKGYRCQLVADASGGWAAAVMTGSDDGRCRFSMLNSIAAERGWEWEPLPEPPDPRHWEPLLRGSFIDDRGRTWQLAGTGDSSWLSLPGQPAVQLAPADRDVAAIPDWGAALALEWAGDELTSLELRQGSLVFRAVRQP